MLNLSLNEDKLLSALNGSNSVKMPHPANINKTIREIRKENRNEGKIFRDFRSRKRSL